MRYPTDRGVFHSILLQDVPVFHIFFVPLQQNQGLAWLFPAEHTGTLRRTMRDLSLCQPNAKYCCLQ